MDNNLNSGDLNPTPTPSVVQPAGAPASGDNNNRIPLISIIVSVISLLIGISGLATGIVAAGQASDLRHDNELLKTYLEVTTEDLESYANGEYEEVDEDDGDVVYIDDEDTTDVEDTQ